MPYCLASRLSFIFTKSTPKESVSSSIFSSSAKTLSQVTQLRASAKVLNNCPLVVTIIIYDKVEGGGFNRLNRFVNQNKAHKDTNMN